MDLPRTDGPDASRRAWDLTMDRCVLAPPSVVWAVITDLEGTTVHLPGIVAVERVSDDGPGAYGVGTRWRETRRMFGQEAVEEMEVEAVDSARRTVVRAEHGAVRYVCGYELLPAGNGTIGPGGGATLLRFRFGAERTGPTSGLRARVGRALGALTAPVGIEATRRAVRTELEAIAGLAERRAADG